MPKTDTDPLGEGFKWRLRAELNRVTPRYSSPRYLAPARHRMGLWRLAPAGLAAGIVVMLALTAYAASGSPNPADWTKQIVTRIGPNAPAEPTPTASPSTSPPAGGAAPPAAAPTEHAQPTTRSEPTEQPRGTPTSGYEGGDDDHQASGARTGSPSPNPGDH